MRFEAEVVRESVDKSVLRLQMEDDMRRPVLSAQLVVLLVHLRKIQNLFNWYGSAFET